MAFLSMESIWFCNEFDLKNSLLGFMKLRYVFLIWEIEELYGKKVFLKYLVVFWIPLSSLHIVLLRTLLGGLFLLGLFFLWGGRFTFHRKKKSFGFLALFGSAVFCFVFGRNHAAAANYRCCLDDWRRNDLWTCQKETGSINIKIRPGIFSETDFLRQ